MPWELRKFLCTVGTAFSMAPKDKIEVACPACIEVELVTKPLHPRQWNLSSLTDPHFSLECVVFQVLFNAKIISCLQHQFSSADHPPSFWVFEGSVRTTPCIVLSFVSSCIVIPLKEWAMLALVTVLDLHPQLGLEFPLNISMVIKGGIMWLGPTFMTVLLWLLSKANGC